MEQREYLQESNETIFWTQWINMASPQFFINTLHSGNVMVVFPCSLIQYFNSFSKVILPVYVLYVITV